MTHAVSSANGWGRRRLLGNLEVLHVHVDVVGHADAGDPVGRRQLAGADDVGLGICGDGRSVDEARYAVAFHLQGSSKLNHSNSRRHHTIV